MTARLTPGGAYVANTSTARLLPDGGFLVVVTASTNTNLVIQSAAHAQLSDNVVLVVDITLAVADALHALASDDVGLTVSVLLSVQDSAHANTVEGLTLATGNTSADLALAIKIIQNRKELDPSTGKYTVYDNDGTTPLLRASAWVDPAGTVPYSGGLVQRVDRLAPV